MQKLLITLLSVMILTQLTAQKVTVKESGDALVTTIYETDQDDIAKDWKSLMKKYDAKVEVSKNKVEAKEAEIKSLSGGKFNVTATMEKIKDGEVKLVVVFDPIATAESKTPDRTSYMSGAKDIVKDFAYKRSSESVGDQVKDAQKAFDKLEKQRDGLIKENENLADDIEKYKKKITDAERDIEVNKGKIEDKKKEVEAQKKVLEAINEKQRALD
ncbi:MAG: hypothetical protein JNL63_01035 [Bacteroidia bacterium]|nr:hypothetical protein [Bacteroidia bacterium]